MIDSSNPLDTYVKESVSTAVASIDERFAHFLHATQVSTVSDHHGLARQYYLGLVALLHWHGFTHTWLVSCSEEAKCVIYWSNDKYDNLMGGTGIRFNSEASSRAWHLLPGKQQPFVSPSRIWVLVFIASAGFRIPRFPGRYWLEFCT